MGDREHCWFDLRRDVAQVFTELSYASQDAFEALYRETAAPAERVTRKGKRYEGGSMTFKQAREAHLAYLQAHGWAIQTKSAKAPWKPLKQPRAIHPNERLVLHFHTQAVYYSHSAQDEGHSLVSDMRAVTPAQLDEMARRM